MNPFISICIPAYKNVEYLQRLLNSISLQTFRDFEVVITDDSNDDSVSKFISGYNPGFKVNYIKNPVALGSPENWNEAIRNAKGQWIKMMHDDDWFTSENSLKVFADIASNRQEPFIFSGYYEVDIDTNRTSRYIISKADETLLKKSPLNLLKRNFIGHPSTTLIKRGDDILYDNNFKWVVDIEFYIRYLNKNTGFVAIKEPLVTIGVNQFQVTKEAFRNPRIEIPENIQFFNKLPTGSLKNIFAYDYFWRLLRNLAIRNKSDVEQFLPGTGIPFIIEKMIKEQSMWPSRLLRIGAVSKTLMLLSYIKNHKRL